MIEAYADFERDLSMTSLQRNGYVHQVYSSLRRG